MESIELVRPVVAQQRRDFIEKWLKEEKLDCTEELGDIVKPLESKFALSIYLRAMAHQKVTTCFAEQGQYEQIVAYVKKVGYQADYSLLLRNMVAVNPEGAANFAKQLVIEGQQSGVPLIDIQQVIDVFMSNNKIQETTSILMDYLKNDLPEQGPLQTKLFEMNLKNGPLGANVAEAIFQAATFTHYDRGYIGKLCEQAGLMQRALEHMTDMAEIKRVIQFSSHTMTPEFMTNYFSRMRPEECLECLYDLLRHNRQNLQVVVQAAIKYHEQIGAPKLIEMFESFGSNDGVFHFLGAILASSTDPEVHFKYIQSASRVGNTQEVERVPARALTTIPSG
jgi:clathrin heavy chain